MAAAVASSADVLANAGDNLPDWMTCDLGAYRILQDVSTQIVANCESFGKHLESVCGDAMKQLPPSDDSTAFDCADACIGFLSAFGALSNVLLALAGDLECSVKTPLQDIILSLTEERTGRMKHWRQVRSRFAELQERYGRSRQRSEAARGKLEKCDNKGKWFVLDKSHKAQQAASEQHAAMCDLAQCEEELNATEASLRRLEDESREWLRQLSREKQVVLRGVLAKGTGSLRRFVSVAEKAAEKAHDAHDQQEVVTPTGWSGVLPSSTNGQEDAPAEKTEEKPSTPPVPQGVVPQPEAECQEEASEKLAATDPSSKYLQNTRAPVELDISELDDSDDEEMAAYRATHWSPAKESPMVSAKSKRRSLVFMGSGSSLIAQSRVHGGSASSSAAALTPLSSPAPQASTPKESPAVSKGLQIGRLAALRDESTASAMSNSDVSTRFRAALAEELEIADISPVEADSEQRADSTCFAWPVAVKPPPVTPSKAMKEEIAPLKASSLPELGNSAPLTKSSTPSEHTTTSSTAPFNSRPAAKDDDDENDEDGLGAAASASASAPLEKPDVDLEIVPLVVESAQKCFEKYVARLHERIAAGAESRWDKILARSNEQQLGGHVGKLECFWICRPGSSASPENADGFVCFQFVQGFAANFARILHLSVVEDGAPGNSSAPSRCEALSSLLPSAIFQVRRFLFETLPVDSLRAVVLAGEDDSGGIYVDADVEVAYVRCNFRWFQLTQTVRRVKKGITRKQKVRPGVRFLVLHSPRRPDDPKAPRNSLGRRPAVLLRSDSSAVAEPESGPATDAPAADLAFSSW